MVQIIIKFKFSIKYTFLLLYNDTITIPGSGTVVGTFKIYCPNENKYLLDDPIKVVLNL